jgi:hypothetical protein
MAILMLAFVCVDASVPVDIAERSELRWRRHERPPGYGPWPGRRCDGQRPVTRGSRLRARPDWTSCAGRAGPTPAPARYLVDSRT